MSNSVHKTSFNSKVGANYNSDSEDAKHQEHQPRAKNELNREAKSIR